MIRRAARVWLGCLVVAGSWSCASAPARAPRPSSPEPCAALFPEYRAIYHFASPHEPAAVFTVSTAPDLFRSKQTWKVAVRPADPIRPGPEEIEWVTGITRVVTHARCRSVGVRRDGNSCVASLSCVYDPATPTDTGLALLSSFEVRGDATWAARRVWTLETELADNRSPCHDVAATRDTPSVTQVCFGAHALDELRWLTVRGRDGNTTELVVTERSVLEE